MNDATSQFLDWGFATYPRVFEAAMQATNAGDGSSSYDGGAMNDSGFGGFFDSLGTAFTNVGTGVGNFFTNFGPNLTAAGNLYLQFHTDKQRLEINKNRARAGCPPIVDWNAAIPPCNSLTYSPTGQPIYGSGGGISGWAVAGVGLGALALILVMQKKGALIVMETQPKKIDWPVLLAWGAGAWLAWKILFGSTAKAAPLPRKIKSRRRRNHIEQRGGDHLPPPPVFTGGNLGAPPDLSP